MQLCVSCSLKNATKALNDFCVERTARCVICQLQVGLKVPLIVRLEGTNVEKGKEILKTSEHTIIPADDLDDAAHKAVKSIS